MTENLAHEERVAFGLLIDGPGQRQLLVSQGMAHPLFHEPGHAGLVQPGEREPLDAFLAAKVGEDLDQRMVVPQLGVPVGADDEQPGGIGSPRHQVTQQEQRRSGRPLEIVEDEEDGLLARGGGQPGGHRVEEPVPLGLRVGLQRRREAGNALRLRYQPGELASVAAQAPGQLLGRHVIHEMAQGLHEGLVRHAEILVAAAGEDRHPEVVHLPRQLGRQAGLAHARLPRQQRQPQVAGHRLLPQLPEPLHLVLTGDEGRPLLGEQGGQGNERREGLPANLANGNRFGEPLELERADIGEADASGAAAGHHLHDGGGQDLPGSGHLHERAASTTGVPKTSPSSKRTSPSPMPMRMASAAWATTACRSTACCMATAHSAASAADPKTASTPSPRVLTSSPPVRWMALRARRSEPGEHRQRPTGPARS